MLLRAVSEDWEGSSIVDGENRPHRMSLSSALYVSDLVSDTLCPTYVPGGAKDNAFVFNSPIQS